MRSQPLIAAFAVVLLLPSAVAAQETPRDGGFTEEFEVSEVLLDVLVTDRDGNVIVGLGEDDFEVVEGGRPVDLTSVTFYSNRPRLDAAGERVEEAASERYFIVFFHDQATSNVAGLLTRQMDAARRSRDWLAELQLDDYVAVVSYDSSLQVHTDFTRDRSEILRALDEAAVGDEPEGNWPSRLPPEGGPSLLRQLPRGKELVKATKDIYDALIAVSEASESLVGRKNLILFSGGFGRINDMGLFEPDRRHQEPMERALNDANVAVYSIDIFPPGTDHALSNQLSLLAEQTGGRFYPNVVNFATPMIDVATETSGYYLLAYQSPHPRGETGFQDVEVRLKNPDLRVKARQGYVFGG
jgi:VWFA-related protein